MIGNVTAGGKLGDKLAELHRAYRSNRIDTAMRRDLAEHIVRLEKIWWADR